MLMLCCSFHTTPFDLGWRSVTEWDILWCFFLALKPCRPLDGRY